MSDITIKAGLFEEGNQSREEQKKRGMGDKYDQNILHACMKTE
jgi:hypothetical protein